MPTETEIKTEILGTIKQCSNIDIVQEELLQLEKIEDHNSRSILQKLYSQWKSGKKGHLNPWNCWTAYYLGITDKQPEGKFFIEKRRIFARPSVPDIDSDFDYEKRHLVIEYLVKKYGRENVANVGTWSGLKIRSAITRIVKALDIANVFESNPKEYTKENVIKVREIVDSLPRMRGSFMKVNDPDTNEEVFLKTIEDVVNAKSRECDDFRYYMEKYPAIRKHAKNIEGLLSIFGVHASGICIADVPFAEIAPMRPGKKNSEESALATQFDYADLEELGIVKFDILAISTLTVVDEAIELIKQNTTSEIDTDNLPLDGKTSIMAKKTYDLYKSGKLLGVFQCDKPQMQQTCIDVGIDNFNDIVAVIALFRPGPMDSIQDYCDRKHGRKPISYFHPTIEPFVKDILAPTYSVLCFQEQVMLICESLAGMTPTQALIIIKGIGKKKEDIIESGHKRFVDGAVKNGVPRDVIEQYWKNFIMPFSRYGFNVAHSYSYGLNSYISCYLKANYPEEFICAYLNVESRRRKLERVLELECEAARMGIKLLPKDINSCGLKYQIVKKKDTNNGIMQSEIRPAIHCKGLPIAAAENIVANRPYASLKEFAEKTDISVVDSESIVALADAGFFKTKKDKALKEFTMYRDDIKALRKKGQVSYDMFEN